MPLVYLNVSLMVFFPYMYKYICFVFASTKYIEFVNCQRLVFVYWANKLRIESIEHRCLLYLSEMSKCVWTLLTHLCNQAHSCQHHTCKQTSKKSIMHTTSIILSWKWFTSEWRLALLRLPVILYFNNTIIFIGFGKQTKWNRSLIKRMNFENLNNWT